MALTQAMWKRVWIMKMICAYLMEPRLYHLLLWFEDEVGGQPEFEFDCEHTECFVPWKNPNGVEQTGGSMNLNLRNEIWALNI